MSYGDSQRIALVRHYLGYADRFRDFETQRQVEQALASISSDTLAIVDGYLDRLAAIDLQLNDPNEARLRMKAEAVGPIKLDAAREVGLLRSQGRETCGRLGSALGIAIGHDVFGPPRSVGGSGFDSNPGGDNWIPHG